jgi:hypothetical protein
MPGYGMKPETPWRHALMRAVNRRMKGEGSPKRLERLADVVVEAAMAGDMAAAREIGDRLDGKAVARQVIEGDGQLLAGFAAILAAVNEERRRRAAGEELGPPIVDVTPEDGAVQQHAEVVYHDPDDAKHAEKPVE